ncbi:uncharacterized protein BP01DRAFT_353934 [Aspergillus saccharolyticus JOP 1030-1]|uniref:Uncharacterized protein n=1 Tax=Aspergillus saccharolyticus JOP 1030-1 TaxID=1450539 RepID=A0A318ZKM1_9EURO|nr:hypothetical protein BP01DRAFT_353934 [Aspergillus saccharolyticus JOP 1030-1]PYH48056.1 hypothetical protein BP01DRAFT_353934 [Aspergillus saccharolyticus JOP 1030-1]
MSDLASSRWASLGPNENATTKAGHGWTHERNRKRASNKAQPQPSKEAPPHQQLDPADLPTIAALSLTSSSGSSSSSNPHGASAPHTNPKIWTSSPRPEPSNSNSNTGTALTLHRLPRVVGGARASLPNEWAHLARSAPDPKPESSPSPTRKSVAKRPIRSLSAAGENLSRYRRIRVRMEWKLRYLVDGYRQATETDAPAERVAVAEQMFKLDFYEYYSYLERGIVHLLLVFDIRISRDARPSGRSWADEVEQEANGGGQGQQQQQHRYHANVLEALRDVESPFYEVLGSGERFVQLQKAKELRNRWKYADMTPAERERDPQTWRASYKAWKDALIPLQSYDFDTIFVQILMGLTEAAEIAQQRVEEVSRAAGQEDSGSESDPDEWDFLVDAMDWEAV